MANKTLATFTGLCTGLTHDGKGIIDYQGIPLYVEQLIKGETAEIAIHSDNGKYAFGSIKKMIKSSPDRATPPCPYFGECGGCQLQHLTYDAQLTLKRERVFKLLKPVVRSLKKAPLITSSSEPFHYRNKSQIPTIVSQGKFLAGYYAAGSHRVVDMDKCMLDQDVSNNIIGVIKALLKRLDIPLTDKATRQGWLTHVVVRTGINTGEVMVILITTTQRLAREKDLVAQLKSKFPMIKTIIHQVKDAETREIYGHTEYVLFGPGFIYDQIDGLTFKLTSRSFFQVNTRQAEVLYRKAITAAAIQPTDRVLDCYCGVGTLSLLAARQAAHVTGVEIIPEAIDNAYANADINHLLNTEFIVDDAIRYMRKASQKGKQFDVVIVDPPRGGLEGDFIHSLISLAPQRVVYVSCDPSTLARDLFALQKAYEVKTVETVDMFSNTFHVETCVLLDLKTNLFL